MRFEKVFNHPWWLLLIFSALLFVALTPRLNSDIRDLNIEDARISIDQLNYIYSLNGQVKFDFGEIRKSIDDFSGTEKKLIQSWVQDGYPQYGTVSYGMTIDSAVEQQIALKISTFVDSRIVVNHEDVYSSGIFDANSFQARRGGQPYVVNFHLNKGDNELIIHVSNEYRSLSGMTAEIMIGPVLAVETYAFLEQFFDMFFISALLFVGFFFFIQSIIVYKMILTSRFYLLIGLSLIILALNSGGYKEKLLFNLFPLFSSQTVFYIADIFRGLSAISGGILILMYKKNVFSPFFRRFMMAYLSSYFIGTLLIPMRILESYTMVYYSFILAFLIPIIIGLIRKLEPAHYDNYFYVDDRATIAIILLPSIYGIGIMVYALGYWQAMIFSYYMLILIIVALVVLVTRNQLNAAKLAVENLDSLKELTALKDEFLKETANQLQKPILSIIQLAEHLYVNPGQKIDLVDVQNIYRSSNRLLLLVNDLVGFEQLEQGLISLDIQPIALDSLIQSVLHEQQDTFKFNKIDISLEINVSHIVIQSDAIRLKQAFYNLFESLLSSAQKIELRIVERDELYLEIMVYHRDPMIVASKFMYSQDLNSQNISLRLFDKFLKLLNIPYERTATENNVESYIMRFINDRSPVLESIPSIKKEREVVSQGMILYISYTVQSGLEIIPLLSQSNLTVQRESLLDDVLRALTTQMVELILIDYEEMSDDIETFIKSVRQTYNIIETPIIVLAQPLAMSKANKLKISGVNEVIRKPVSAYELQARIDVYQSIKINSQALLKQELYFLQSQIKPHFIFNTLSTIIALIGEEPYKAAALLEHLSDYLRSIVGVEFNDKMGTLQDELDLIDSYVSIEKARFNERIQIQFEIDTESRMCPMPPLLIQPLIENAIKHGILAKEEGGMIMLRTKLIGNKLSVEVRDDGVGMTQAKIQSLQAATSNQRVGISNVMLRLKKLYQSDLKISSRLREGTSMSFSISIKERL